MKFRTCAIALAALLATGLGFDRAHADVDCTASSQWTTASGCPSSKRVLAADTTCLTGGTDVEIVDGEARRTVSVQNECSDHGQIVAHVERVEADDLMICLGSAELTTVSVPAVTAVSCCFEGEEDLCFEDQVEADANGKIKRRTVGSPTAVTEVDVSTHLRRWHFCQDFPDDVYCKVNPSGDALTMPAHAACGGEGQPACNTILKRPRPRLLRQPSVHRRRLRLAFRAERGRGNLCRSGFGGPLPDDHQRDGRQQPVLHDRDALRPGRSKLD